MKQLTFPSLSYDARAGMFSEGVSWEDEEVLGRRAIFRPLEQILNIAPVEVTDHGGFSCRVEFIKSPTATVVFLLFVISEFNETALQLVIWILILLMLTATAM